MFSLGLATIAVTYTTPWRALGIIGASLLVGTTAQLGFTEPMWFQGIKLQSNLKSQLLLQLFLILQLVVGLYYLFNGGIKRNFFGVLSQNLPKIGFIKLTLITLLLLGTSISFMPFIKHRELIPLAEQVLLSNGFWLLNVISVIALLLHTHTNDAAPLFNRFIAPTSSFNKSSVDSGDRKFALTLALWLFLASALVCFFGFERVPHVEDELVYLFQSKYLLLGQLSAPPPIEPEAFQFYLLQVADDKWYTITLPGWPLVLALGSALDVAWLVNPFLAGLSILLAHSLTKQLLDRTSANIIILLMACSPWLIATSASLMNHTLTLVLTLATWLAFINAKRKHSVCLALTAGLFAGFMVLVRPLDGLIMGLLTGFWSLTLLKQSRGWLLVFSYSLGCILIGGLVLPFNEHITGDPLLMPQNDYINQLWGEGKNRLGFGDDIGPPTLWGSLDLYRGHNLKEALINTQQSSYMTNFELLGWGIGSLILAFILLVWGKLRRIETYMLIFVLAIIACYSLYWFSGSFYIGPRYWFMIFFPLIVLSAGGVRVLTKSINANAILPGFDRRLVITLLILCLVTVLAFIPWRAGTRYYEYRDYHDAYRQLLSKQELSNSLLFIRSQKEEDFASAFIFTEPDFAPGSPVFAYDLGLDSNLAIASQMQQRPIYYVSGRDTNSKQVQIIEGPLNYKDLLQRQTTVDKVQ